MKKEIEIPKDKEYAIRTQTPEEKKEKENAEDVPVYLIELKLEDTEIDRLKEQVFLEFDAMVDERKEAQLEDKWKERDNQYDGEASPNKQLAFNLHVGESKIKVDAIARAINEAFIDSDPKIDCSPRPESGRQDGFEIAEKQAQFLDFAMDEEIKPETALIKIAKCAIKKFVGIGKLKWAYKRQPRRREEVYEGKNEIIGVDQEGNPIIRNEGLERFLQTYPDALEDNKGIVKRLYQGKKVEIVVQYKDTIDNNPQLDYIKLENFYVKNSTEYWQGLRDTHCIVERQTYSYWELQDKKDSGEFINVDKLYGSEEELNETTEHKTADYDVLEITTYFRVKEGDKEEAKIKTWFSEEKKVYLGANIYPYYGFDVDYIPFYVNLNDYGFYGDAKSVLLDLKDLNIAENALLNLALHGEYVRNIITPIVREGSEVEKAFLDNEFVSGRPIVVDELTDDVSKAIDFVKWPNVDINGSMMLMEKLKRIGDDLSRVSGLATGGESQLDPTAPASKTIALLQQSGIGIKDYIRTFLPSFNVFAAMILQLYYQMSQEDKKFKVVGKAFAVTGDNPFSEISREEMVVKTNVQSRAASFAFDKVNEKKEAMAAYQIIMADPYARQQPKLLYKALTTLLETFGQKWKTISDTDLASPEEFQQQMNQIAMEAIQALGQQAQAQAQTTGVAPDKRQLLEAAPNAVQTAQANAYAPPEEKK